MRQTAQQLVFFFGRRQLLSCVFSILLLQRELGIIMALSFRLFSAKILVKGKKAVKIE